MLSFGSKSSGDAKWRGTIERALASWDSVVEWGDYIVFLSRLEKAIKSKAGNGTEMPLAGPVSEALSRCLDPSLPAGVHQTTIQVYNTLFTSIPRSQLDKQINIWLPGILPLVSYAAFNVKPQVIQLLETHVLSVPNLRELCRPLLLSTLPSIEDESSECYTEILGLITKIKSNLGDDVLMWQCIAMCCISSSECRLGALNYFGQFLPSLEFLDEQSKPVVSPEPGIFLRAVSSGLMDSNIFVQRGFLDILAKSLPIHSQVFKECAESDFASLLYSACSTILRKDMSLNRRLWAWLLGPDPELSETKLSRVDYFKKSGANALKEVLLKHIPTDLSDVCLIVHGLMDRWELATVIVPDLFIPIIQAAKEYPDQFAAVSQLFNGVESNLIWKCALKFILDGDTQTVQYILDNFNVQEEEMLSVHLPLVLLACVSLKEPPQALAKTFLKLIPASSFTALSSFENNTTDPVPQIMRYYEESLGSEEGDIDPPFSTQEVTEKIGSFLVKSYHATNSSVLLTLFIEHLPSFSARIPELIEAMLSSKPDCQLFASVSSTMDYTEKSLWIRSGVESYFKSLSSDQSLQVEVVRDIWVCHESAGELLVPSALSQCFAQCQTPLHVGRAFNALWVHSIDRSGYDELLAKPTLLFLDLLATQSTKELAQLFVRSAIVSTNTVDKLLKILFNRIKTGDSALLEYYLNHIKRLVFGSDLKEVKKVFLSQFSKPFLEFFRELLFVHQNDECYAVGISIIQGSTLEADKLNVSALTSVLETLILESKATNTPLLQFINTVLPHVPFDKRVTFGDQDTLEYQLFNVLNNSIKVVSTEPEVAAMASFLETFLAVFKESVPQIVYPITVSLVTRLNELTEELETNTELVLQFILCLDRLLFINFQYLYDAKGGHFSSYEDVVNSSEGATASKLLGNVISGVFSVESPGDRSAIQNGRVLLYEAIDMTMAKCCAYWESMEKSRVNTATNAYSTALYTTGRFKTRLRKLTALLYKYEPIETIKLCAEYSTSIKSAVKFVHMIEGSRYKNTVQVLFDNILTPQQYYQKSVANDKLFDFLKQYIKTLESDVLEDIWNVFMNFCVEITTKASQYQPILMDILQVLVIVSKKLDGTSFGQTKRLRKDLADQFTKLFNAVLEQEDFDALIDIVPSLSIAVQDIDKQTSLIGKVVGMCVSRFKGDSWANVPISVARLFAVVVENSTNPRVWKQHFTDLFFDSRFFTLSLEQARSFMHVIDKWVQLDKERVSEFLGRIATYGSNSVLFGWSSNSSFVDHNLKRLSLMVLCAEQLPLNTTKLINQLATIWSNKESVPCSCLLLRALALVKNQSQIYVFIGFKLQGLFSDLHSVIHKDLDELSLSVLIEGTKLLDFVLTLEPDEFQMYEWLFICDSADAIYPRQTPQERAGDILDKLASKKEINRLASTSNVSTIQNSKREPLVPRYASIGDVTAFFSQASISLYEEMYSLARADETLLKEHILGDMFK